MRLQPVRAPDALDVREADPGRLCHRPPGPMRRLARWLRQRERDDALSHLWPERRDAGRARLVPQEAIGTFAGEALLPAPDGGLALARPTHDRVRAKPVSRGQDDRGTPRVLLRAVGARSAAVTSTVIPGRMPQTRTLSPQHGIPNGTPLSLFTPL